MASSKNFLRAELSFIAMLPLEKYGQQQSLNRQTDRFAHKGVPLSVCTLTEQVIAATFALMPIYRRIEAHVLAADRLHGDGTTVLVMVKGKTHTARLRTDVRDIRPFAVTDPPAALFHSSRDRRAGHPRAHLATCRGSFRLTLMQLQRALRDQPATRARAGSRLFRSGSGRLEQVWEYIKAHNLQDPADKRIILADEALKKISGRIKCTMFEMNKYLARHLKRPSPATAAI